MVLVMMTLIVITIGYFNPFSKYLSTSTPKSSDFNYSESGIHLTKTLDYMDKQTIQLLDKSSNPIWLCNGSYLQ